MITKIETSKVLLSAINALNTRWVKTASLRDIAIREDLENRQKLIDPTLSPEDFTKYSNLARAAQRRRANLHDKMLEIEDSLRTKAAELQMIAAELATAPLVVPSPELAQVDNAYLENETPEQTAEQTDEEPPFIDPEQPEEMTDEAAEEAA